jgi:hypothetical protein
MHVSLFLSFLFPAGLVLGATYHLSDNVVGAEFDHFFSYFTDTDPTHGRVNYVNKSTAASKNLTFPYADGFLLRSDDQQTLLPDGPGRESVRLTSNKEFTTSVIVYLLLAFQVSGCSHLLALM